MDFSYMDKFFDQPDGPGPGEDIAECKEDPDANEEVSAAASGDAEYQPRGNTKVTKDDGEGSDEEEVVVAKKTKATKAKIVKGKGVMRMAIDGMHQERADV
jgi:hypothetical protein